MNARAEWLEMQLEIEYRRDEIAEQLNLADMEAESVIFFNYQFSSSTKVYTYAAVKCDNGLWYSTGPRAPKGYTDTEFEQWLANGVIDVWYATEWEQVL